MLIQRLFGYLDIMDYIIQRKNYYSSKLLWEWILKTNFKSEKNGEGLDNLCRVTLLLKLGVAFLFVFHLLFKILRICKVES